MERCSPCPAARFRGCLEACVPSPRGVTIPGFTAGENDDSTPSVLASISWPSLSRDPVASRFTARKTETTTVPASQITTSRPLKCDHGLRRQAIVQSLLTEVFEGRLRAGQHLVTQE